MEFAPLEQQSTLETPKNTTPPTFQPEYFTRVYQYEPHRLAPYVLRAKLHEESNRSRPHPMTIE